MVKFQWDNTHIGDKCTWNLIQEQDTLHCVPKHGDTKLVAVTLLVFNGFSYFYTVRFYSN